ncbi:MAG: hypothetical protein LBE83_03250 [Propionibacteriaceae bacterium]|jgi:hypothetical protein|nr:hypothetical protein [Propionibacteriaceae bacterium]
MELSWFGILVIVGMVGLAVVMVVVAQAQRRQRIERLSAWALANDLTYTASDPSLRNRWPGLPFVRGGQYIDVISGRTRNYRPFCAFRYHYTVDSAESSQSYDFAVFVLRLPMPVPTMQLTKEGIGAKVAKAFGGQDIRIGIEPFDRTYRIQSTSEPFTRALLTPTVANWLTGPGLNLMPWRLIGNDLLCWRPGLLEVTMLWPQLEMMETLIGLMAPQMGGPASGEYR